MYMGTAVLLVLAAIGGIATVGWISRKLWKMPPDTQLWVPVAGNREDIEYAVRAALHFSRQTGIAPPVVVDTGMTAATRQLAEEVCARLGVECR